MGGGGCLEKNREVYKSQIHERTISLKVLGLISRVLILEVSVYNVYIKPLLLKEGGE